MRTGASLLPVLAQAARVETALTIRAAFRILDITLRQTAYIHGHIDRSGFQFG